MKIPTRLLLVLITFTYNYTHFVLLVLIASQEAQEFMVDRLSPSRTMDNSA